jgi:hypothetical protein
LLGGKGNCADRVAGEKMLKVYPGFQWRTPGVQKHPLSSGPASRRAGPYAVGMYAHSSI